MLPSILHLKYIFANKTSYLNIHWSRYNKPPEPCGTEAHVEKNNIEARLVSESKQSSFSINIMASKHQNQYN